MPGIGVGELRATVRFYVSPKGNDAWTGEIAEPKLHLLGGRDGPFRTLSRAFDALARLRTEAEYRDDAVILLRRGTYRLSQPLLLEGDDPAVASGQVTVRAFPGESVVLQRSTETPRWIKDRDGLFHLPVPSDSWEPPTGLLWKGKVQIQARFPNFDDTHPCSGGFLYAADPGPGAAGNALAVRPGDIPPALWPTLENTTVSIWPGSGGPRYTTHISHADEQRRILYLADLPAMPPGRGTRYYLRNTRALLDVPGEWVYDAGEAMLLFRPPDGRPPRRRTVVIGTSPIVLLRGTAGHPVRNVTFKNLEFRGGGEALLVWRNTSHCRLLSCRLRTSARDGIRLLGSGDACRIAGNDVEAIPGTAILVETGYTDTVITNNWIRRCGDLGTPSLIMNGSGIVSNNLLHDLGGAGMRLAGSVVTCGDNVLHHTFNRRCGGGIIEIFSANGTGQTILLRRNWLHHSGGYAMTAQGRWNYPAGVAGVLMDRDGIVELRDNRIQQASLDGLSLRRGCAIVQNTLFLHNAGSQIRIVEAVPGAAELRIRNCLFAYNGFDASWLAASRPLPEVVKSSDGNLVWPYAGSVRLEPTSCSGPDHWQWWRDAGFDLQSVVADPCFVAPSDGNYRLRPDSFALKLGFVPLGVGSMGLKVSAERETLPNIVKPWREAYLPGPWGSSGAGDALAASRVHIPATPLYLPHRVSPPILDGLCGENEWADNTFVELLIRDLEMDPGHHTISPAVLRLAHDGSRLYVSVTVPVSSLMSGIRWEQDDGVELALAPPSAQSYLRLRGFPNGTALAADVSDAGTRRIEEIGDRGIVYAACILPKAWSCEWSIPLPRKDGGQSPVENLRFRVVVHRGETSEHLVWPPPTTGLPDSPPRGRLTLMPPS